VLITTVHALCEAGDCTTRRPLRCRIAQGRALPHVEPACGTGKSSRAAPRDVVATDL
jgi:hypothetical protein